jgi:hypothetical protein
MSGTSETLHGSAPDQSPVALLLVDVINPLDFPEADQLLRHAIPAVKRLAELKARARSSGRTSPTNRSEESVPCPKRPKKRVNGRVIVRGRRNARR